VTSGNLALVAESDNEVLAQLQSVLTELGLVAVAVRDGVEALRLIDRGVPSLVLADVGLGVFDGYALCASDRRNRLDPSPSFS
jgi:CheY-like chemotaxis protein